MPLPNFSSICTGFWKENLNKDLMKRLKFRQKDELLENYEQTGSFTREGKDPR